MKNTIVTIVVALLTCYVLAVSCSSDNKACSGINSHEKPPLNPNGDSELALLMRAMFDEAQQIKQQIANEYPINLSLEHEKILTAHATEPQKVASTTYKAFATAYLQAVNELKTANPNDRLTIYDNMVNNCMSCHQALCPGPIVKIKKLQ